MAKKTKKNIAKGVRKKKRQAQREIQRKEEQEILAKQEQMSPEELKKIKEKEKKQADKEYEAKRKAAERKANPTFWDKTVNYFKSTVSELKKTQWLTAAQLNKATASVFGVVSVFTVITWIIDSGLGALTALILGI